MPATMAGPLVSHQRPPKDRGCTVVETPGLARLILHLFPSTRASSDSLVPTAHSTRMSPDGTEAARASIQGQTDA